LKNMNVRLSRKLALVAALAVAAPAARAADVGPQLAAANSSTAPAPTASDKAAEAQRLAALAAQLAQQAAQLAAESNSAAPATAAPAAADPLAGSNTGWSSRGSAGKQAAAPATTIISSQPIAAAEPAAAAAGDANLSGWRKHRKAEDIAIRFKGQEAPRDEATTLTATPIANADVAPVIKQLPPTTSAAPVITEGAQISRPASAPSFAAGLGDLAAATAGALAETQLLNDANVQQAARMAQDEDLIPEAEAVPPPPYAEPNGRKNRKSIDTDGEEPLPVGHGGEVYGCDPCCPPPRMLFWTAGVEATFLNPDLNNSFAQFGVIEAAEDRVDYFDTETTDTDSFYLAPRIWIGVQGRKWGVNLRYFHLNANEGAYDPVLGSDGSWDGENCGVPDFGYSSCNTLEAYTIDLEVTRRVCVHNCAMQFSMGVRHASLSQDEQISGAALTDDSAVFGFASAHRESRGTGLVFGWYGRRPIFPCSCVHWFYNARFSPVWGPTQTASETGAMIAVTDPGADVVGAAGSVNNASTYVDDTMFIGEIQLGLEWEYGLRCLPANAFFRAAVEYQRWDGGRGYTAAGSFVGAEDNGDLTTFGETFASATEPQLDLVGLTLGTGLTW
jgi:hypothetical protein